MAKESIYRHSRTVVGFNITPMIDCTFQLIIFFMLVTQMVSADYVQMELPRPHENTADKLEGPNKVIINVAPYPPKAIAQDQSLKGWCKEYSVGLDKISKGNLKKLESIIINTYRKSPNPEQFVVELRADRDIHYSELVPVLQTVRDAKLQKMRITVLKRGGGS